MKDEIKLSDSKPIKPDIYGMLYNVMIRTEEIEPSRNLSVLKTDLEKLMLWAKYKL